MAMPVVQSIYTCFSLIYIVLEIKFQRLMQIVYSKVGTIHNKPRIIKV